MNLYTEVPLPWLQYDNNSLFRLNCDFWNSGRICWNIFWSSFLQYLLSKHLLWTQNVICGWRDDFSAINLRPDCHLCALLHKALRLFFEDSVWTAHDSHVVSLYGRDDSVHHDKVHKEKISRTWGWLPKESWRYYIYQYIEIRSKFNWFPVSFNDAQGMYSEFLKIHFAKTSVWCSIKQTFYLNKWFFYLIGDQTFEGYCHWYSSKVVHVWL